MNEHQKRQTKFSAWYFVGALMLVFLLQSLVIEPLITGRQEVSYDQFRQHLADKSITEVTIQPERIHYKIKDEEGEEKLHNVVRVEDADLTDELLAAGAEFRATPPSGGAFSSLFGWLLPLLPLVLIWYFIIMRMGQGAGNILTMGKSKAREIETLQKWEPPCPKASCWLGRREPARRCWPRRQLERRACLFSP